MQPYIVSELDHFCNVHLKNRGIMGKSVIEYYDFSFILSGSVTYIINGETYILHENDAILLPPGTKRERLSVEEAHFVSFNFYAYDGAIPKTDLYLPNCINREMRALCSVFPEQHISPFYHSKEKLMNILNCLLFELFDTLKFNSNNENIVAILKYIDANLTTQITLKGIADHVHLSRDYIAHIFKRELGKPVIDYVNERRMQMAKNMMADGGMPLTEISATLGYTSYSYFSRVFKHYFKVSPIKYKSK